MSDKDGLAGDIISDYPRWQLETLYCINIIAGNIIEWNGGFSTKPRLRADWGRVRELHIAMFDYRRVKFARTSPLVEKCLTSNRPSNHPIWPRVTLPWSHKPSHSGAHIVLCLCLASHLLSPHMFFSGWVSLNHHFSWFNPKQSPWHPHFVPKKVSSGRGIGWKLKPFACCGCTAGNTSKWVQGLGLYPPNGNLYMGNAVLNIGDTHTTWGFDVENDVLNLDWAYPYFRESQIFQVRIQTWSLCLEKVGRLETSVCPSWLHLIRE